MKGSQLLNGKFIPVKVPTACAPCHSLLRKFNNESGKRVIFVSAPAGYGKTVSTQLWLANSGRETIWIDLDGYDNTLSIFYKLFCTGILSIQPENKLMASILKDPGFADSPVEHSIRFLSEFVPDNKQYAVVVDNMHLITNEEIRKSGLFVQKRLPLSFIVLILTRNEVADEYISIVGKDKCSVIAAQDLAFSAEEIQKYFSWKGLYMTLDKATEVYAATGGWAIGINALGISGQIELEHGGQVLENYIKKQIWDKWDEDLRNFMLKTAIVDEITSDLCERLTGCEDGQGALDELCHSNPFISKISEDNYRYDHLFLDFMRHQIEESALSTKELYKQAAEYYIENDEYLTARRYAIKSEDSETIIRMLHGFIQYCNDTSLQEFVDFSETFNKDDLPEPVRDKYPFLYASHFWGCYLSGDVKRTEYYLDKLYHYLPVITSDFPKFLILFIFEITLDHRAPLLKQFEFFQQVPSSANDYITLRGASLTLKMPFLHRSGRNYYDLPNKELPAQLLRTFDMLLNGHVEVLNSGILSGLFLEQNKLNDAMNEALAANQYTDENTSSELKYAVLLHLSAIYYAMEDNKRFNETMNQTEDYIESSGADYLRPNFMAYKSKIQLLSGNKAAARAWLDNYFVSETGHLELYKLFQHFTTARAYIVLGQTEQAMNYILRLKQLVTDFRRPLDIAEASVLQAVLEWALGNREEALYTLETALISMQEYGFIRVISDEGAAVLPILKKLTLHLKRADGQSTLNVQYLNEVNIAAYKQSKRHKGIAVNILAKKPVKLSKRQKLMVTLLSEGYKNADITELTGLSIYTVKSHCATAYAKLNVNNAMDAVIRAQELGIIKQ